MVKSKQNLSSLFEQRKEGRVFIPGLLVGTVFPVHHEGNVYLYQIVRSESVTQSSVQQSLNLINQEVTSNKGPETTKVTFTAKDIFGVEADASIELEGFKATISLLLRDELIDWPVSFQVSHH